MNLVKSRDEIRALIEANNSLDNPVLNAYKLNRDSEMWRVSKVVEELCEYILYLEGKAP